MCRIGDTAHVSSPGGTAIVVNAGFCVGDTEPGDRKVLPPHTSNLGEVRLWYQISKKRIYGRISKQILYHNRASPKLVYLLFVHYHRVKPLTRLNPAFTTMEASPRLLPISVSPIH